MKIILILSVGFTIGYALGLIQQKTRYKATLKQMKAQCDWILKIKEHFENK